MSMSKSNNLLSKISKYLNVLQALSVFLIMFFILSVLFPRFFTLINITNLVKQLSVIMILGAGVTFCMIAGELDISIGSVVGLAGVSAALIMPRYGVTVAIVVSLIVGALVGLFNGLVTTKGKVPSFITTLGSLLMARSLAYVFTKGKVLSGFPDVFRFLGQGEIGGVPILFIIVIIIYGISYVLLKKTKFGLSVYAVGSNRKAAILSGINADKIKIITFIISGILAGFGAILLSSRTMAVQAMTGSGLEFEVIAAVVIGGASLKGGEGNVLQTIVGVLIIGLIRNGLNMSQVDVYWNDFVKGFVIVFAVLLDSFRKVLQDKISERTYISKRDQ